MIDASAFEVDEIMDFAPEEGDEIWIRLRHPGQSGKQMPLANAETGTDHARLSGDSVRLGDIGEIEFKFEDGGWAKIVGIRSSNLKLFASEEDDGLSLKFTREF